jgi:uncharacterized cofD-like protein
VSGGGASRQASGGGLGSSDVRGGGGGLSGSAVAIGGGHGLARSLQALSTVCTEVTAVVTVADDGGSSGRLRRDLGVLPPGDLRMALAALAVDDELVRLLQYRFDRGELRGHSLGNLVLVALQDLAEGDVVRALRWLGRFLQVPGRVVPSTTTPVTLYGETTDGHVRGQVAVAATAQLRKVWLEPDDAEGPAVATPEALEAIAAADLVVLGPGSLYTSLLPNLLVPSIHEAVAASSAQVVLVANLREQPGETEGMSLRDHLDALDDHVPGLHLDVLVAHDGPPPLASTAPLRCDPATLTGHVGRIVRRDLLADDGGHDAAALASAFREVLSAATTSSDAARR